MRTCDLEGCEKPHRARGLCATHYNQQTAQRHRKVEMACSLCGAVVLKHVRNDRSRRYCSTACRSADPRNYVREQRACRVPEDHPARWFGDSSTVCYIDCHSCGEVAVHPAWGHRTYCSERCSRRARSRRVYRRGTRKRRKLTRRASLFARDNYICWLCNTPTDPSVHYLADTYPSLDHVVPRNHGGSDDPSNLRTAHRICNSARRDQEEVVTMPPPAAA